MNESIKLTQAEVQSCVNRVKWAENLILQLPVEHEGRNSWLLNYGHSPEAHRQRKIWEERTGKQLWPDTSGGTEAYLLEPGVAKFEPAAVTDMVEFSRWWNEFLSCLFMEGYRGAQPLPSDLKETWKQGVVANTAARNFLTMLNSQKQR